MFFSFVFMHMQVHPCPKGLGKHRELVNRSGGKEPYVIPFLCIILTEKLFSLNLIRCGNIFS